MGFSRRTITRLFIGAPLAGVAGALAGAGGLLGPRTAAAQEPAPEPAPAPASDEPEDTPLGRFLARREDLTREERRRVRRDVASLEQALKEIRDHALGNDVPPAGSFRPLRSRRA